MIGSNWVHDADGCWYSNNSFKWKSFYTSYYSDAELQDELEQYIQKVLDFPVGKEEPCDVCGERVNQLLLIEGNYRMCPECLHWQVEEILPDSAPVESSPKALSGGIIDKASDATSTKATTSLAMTTPLVPTHTLPPIQPSVMTPTSGEIKAFQSALAKVEATKLIRSAP